MNATTRNTYENSVDHFARNNVNWTFKNSGIEHAKIVVSRIFRHSEKVIRIFANNLSGDVTNEILKDINGFLSKKDTILYIALDRNSETESDVLKLLLKYQSNNPSQIILKSANSTFKESTKGLFKNLHQGIYFIVGDERMYRVEYDNERHAAECNFNDSTVAKKLIKSFDQKFSTFEKLKFVNPVEKILA